MQWCCVSYMGGLRLRQRRKRERKPGRNIWTDEEYLTAFVGRESFDDARQERARSCRSQTRERGMLDDHSAGQKKPE